MTSKRNILSDEQQSFYGPLNNSTMMIRGTISDT